jgi:hypothetical protein
MIAVDDGLVNGNLNLADVFFLVAGILFALAAILAYVYSRPRPNGAAVNVAWWPGVLTPLGLALVAFGWFVL